MPRHRNGGDVAQTIDHDQIEMAIVDDSNGARNAIEVLAERYRSQPGAYRPSAQVFRVGDGGRQGSWVADIPCADLVDAHRWIASHQYGGPGSYDVAILNAHSGRRANAARVRVDADMRAAAAAAAVVASTPAPPSREEGASVIDRLVALLERDRDRARPVEPQISWAQAQSQIDAAREDARKAWQRGYDEGRSFGHRMGLMEGSAKHRPPSDSWTPGDVKDMVREVGGMLRAPRADGVASTTIETVLETAMAVGASPQQTIAFARTMMGPDVVRAVAASWGTIVDEIRRTSHPLAAWLTDEVSGAIRDALAIEVAK
jgi:hypothetical protein